MFRMGMSSSQLPSLSFSSAPNANANASSRLDPPAVVAPAPALEPCGSCLEPSSEGRLHWCKSLIYHLGAVGWGTWVAQSVERQLWLRS